MARVCPRCAKENPDDARFCSKCGLDFSQVVETGPTTETRFCHWHPREATNLACGRCGRPVCTKCVVLGPAGPRCRECARSNVAVRPAAVLYSLSQGLKGVLRQGPYTIWIWVVVASMLFGMVRGCMGLFGREGPQRQPASEQTQSLNDRPSRE